MRPFFTQADIERLYRDPDDLQIDLSAELIEHHIQRGRAMRSQVAADMVGGAARGLKRLFGGSGRRDHAHGDLKPSNV